jgi:hypothetical protein
MGKSRKSNTPSSSHCPNVPGAGEPFLIYVSDQHGCRAKMANLHFELPTYQSIFKVSAWRPQLSSAVWYI